MAITYLRTIIFATTMFLLLVISPIMISCAPQATQPSVAPSAPTTPFPQPITPPPTSTPAPSQPQTTPPKPAPASKEVELKYDDGKFRVCLPVLPDRETGGFLIDFTPPSVPFVASKIRIFGLIYGKAMVQNFKVEIWDKDKKVIYSIEHPVDKFPATSPGWVEISIPNIDILDKFYVHIYTGTGVTNGIQLGADDSIPNEHSSVTSLSKSGESSKETMWPYPLQQWFGDKSKVNWMIRVVGTY